MDFRDARSGDPARALSPRSAHDRRRPAHAVAPGSAHFHRGFGGEAAHATGLHRSVLPRRIRTVTMFHRLLLTAMLWAAAAASASDLTLNDREYFTTRGLDVLAFSNV